MKIYQIQLAKEAEKSLLKIVQSLPAIGRRINAEIEELKKNPYSGIKLQGSDQETRRIRVGDYRIVYEVYENYLVILIVYVGPRGSAYK